MSTEPQFIDAALMVAEKYADLADQRDAALEVLRPFARAGKALQVLEWHPEGLVIFEEESGSDLPCSVFLAALEFWQSHRPGEEP